ncbi:MAG: hypothetical protein L0H84_23235, partial [Pseudonocardia sp.]|nr:hypothetical protein [Pseudonocardia sp.]
MNREQFFAKLAGLDEERLRKALWTLYWRGSATMRERIEAELEPEQRKAAKRVEVSVDPQTVLIEVREFISLARAGAYMGGDRRVSRSERSRWRLTFRQLATDAKGALVDPDIKAGAEALEQLVDLACETRHFEYFHTEDPMEAAKFVVSDAVALLWQRLRDAYGFAGFAERAAPQLFRWESRYGWTRSGWGTISEKESSLAGVVSTMLVAPDMWLTFADSYLAALDQSSTGRVARVRDPWRDDDFSRGRRTGDLAAWHLMLLERLADYDATDRLEKLVEHPALGGPELTYLQARLAGRLGDLQRARDLVHESLTTLPGHSDFLSFAIEIGATLPARAQRAAEERG